MAESHHVYSMVGMADSTECRASDEMLEASLEREVCMGHVSPGTWLLPSGEKA